MSGIAAAIVYMVVVYTLSIVRLHAGSETADDSMLVAG